MSPISDAGDAGAAGAVWQSRARFFGPIPHNYPRLNRELLALASAPEPESGLEGKAAFQAAASTEELDRVVKVLPLPSPIPPELSSSAILGMERLRELGELTALRGDRPTDLPRPDAGRAVATVRRHAPALIELVEQIERDLCGSSLFVRAIKLDRARVSTTAPGADATAAHLHFDAERSSLADYAEPVFQFYVNAGQLERQFRILPVARDAILEGGAGLKDAEHQPLEAVLGAFLKAHSPILETLPVESGALAIFDGRQFAHDAGKSDVEALASGRLQPSAEPDLVVALDTAETGYHLGHYRPELPFFEDCGV